MALRRTRLPSVLGALAIALSCGVFVPLRALAQGAPDAVPWEGKALQEEPVQDTTLDPSFDGDGRAVVAFDVGGLNPDFIGDARSDRNGGYWAIGRAHLTYGPRYILAIAHLNHAGGVISQVTKPEYEMDNEIPSRGVFFQVQDSATDAAGKLLLTAVRCTSPNVSQCQSLILRMNSDGLADMGFNGTGVIATAYPTTYFGITVATNQEIWVGRNIGIERFSSTGAPLGTVAMAHTPISFARTVGGLQLALTSQTSLEIAARVIRLDASGALDLTFAGDGIVDIAGTPEQCHPNGSLFDPRELDALPDGRYVVLGDVLDSDFNVVHSYAAGGTATGAFGSLVCIQPDRIVGGIALRADGRVFVSTGRVATASSPTARGMGLKVFQFQGNGTLVVDPGFNGGQPLGIEFPAPPGFAANAVSTRVIVDQGSPVVFGGAQVSSVIEDFAIARLVGDQRLFVDGFEN